MSQGHLEPRDPRPYRDRDEDEELDHSFRDIDTPEASIPDDEINRIPSRSTDGPDLEIGDDGENHKHTRFQIPIWLQESSKSFRFKWVPLPLRKAGRSVVDWSKGPDNPHRQRVRPWFPVVQEAPIYLVKQFLPKWYHKAVGLALLLGAWLLTFSLILRHQLNSGEIEGYGKPDRIWCGERFWYDGNSCGMDGNNCRPFENAQRAFQCSAGCGDMIISYPYTVGDTEFRYTTQVIGGPVNDTTNAIYRGDSFICQAAIHAGVISNKAGGCGVVSLKGNQPGFEESQRYGIQSYSFDSQFPQSYTFLKDIDTECGNVDMRWALLAVTLVFSCVIGIFTWTAATFFPCIFTLTFVHVALVSDPPNRSNFLDLLSLAVEHFLPAAFVAFAMYRFGVRKQLAGLTAQVEKTILYLGGLWLGALSNYTFSFIPVSRLTPGDLNRPGAALSVSVIVILVFCIALGQIYYFRLEGLLRRYLAIYALMGIFLLVCVAIPNLSLRLHHYTFALVLVPGTRLQTRPSMLYQGLLIGLFINGIARWGFASILETTAALSGGRPIQNVLPDIAVPLLGLANLTFTWNATLPYPYDGLSLLVNDVERFRWYEGEFEPSFVWDTADGVKRYFRWAYMRGSWAGDYSKAGTWSREGGWSNSSEDDIASISRRWMGFQDEMLAREAKESGGYRR